MLSPDEGQTTVTWASALRQWRMRPAATCLKSKKIAYKQEILEVRYGKVVSVQHTSPPPITMTGLSRTCQARIRDPPPWILGNLVELMLFLGG